MALENCAFVLDALDSHIAVLNDTGVLVWVNSAWREFGQCNGAVPGTSGVGVDYFAICEKAAQNGDADAAVVLDGLRRLLKGEETVFLHEYPCHCRGSERWFQLNARAIRMPDNRMQVVVSHFDTTRAKQNVQAVNQTLLETMEVAQIVQDNVVDGVFTVNEDGWIETFNHSAGSIFGYTPAEIVQRQVGLIMLQPERALRTTLPERYQIDTQVPARGHAHGEIKGIRKSGEHFPMSIAVIQVVRSGRVTYVCIVRDESLQRRNEEEIRRLAFYDSLTGLPNRRLLLDRMQHALASCARTSMHGAIMFLDLDHFKLLNDSWGHRAGDLLLQQVAARIKACVREDDSVARMGGDEFVVLLEALSTNVNEAVAQAEAVARKVMAALENDFILGDQRYQSTPSIGIVVFLEAHETVEELVRRADTAMYQAKAAGRNTLRFFDPAMQAAVQSHAELEADLRRGLERHEFVLHYQPQVDRAGNCLGFEALVRWSHPRRGMVSPAQFIPLAEECGVILPLGQWVLETACDQLVAWADDEASRHWTIAVNVSASQFAQDEFVSQVKETLKRKGANPALLKLELTESMLVTNISDIVSKMHAIREAHVGFSLDDFGTGYSSLAYLKKLPLDQLKIDQSFVRDVLSDPSDAVIARTVVALGHSLGLKVIAEGVETEEQRNFLEECGCDAFQGYFFGRPVAADALTIPEQVLRQVA